MLPHFLNLDHLAWAYVPQRKYERHNESLKGISLMKDHIQEGFLKTKGKKSAYRKTRQV